ncbi:MAG: hypothetical protein SNJ58_04300 [Aggregatilineales bacterium]
MSERLQNPFLEDWRECLLAHYRWIVARKEDKVEPTVRHILLSVGVPEARIAELQPGSPEPELTLPPAPEPEPPPEAHPPSEPEPPALPKQLSLL